MRASLCWSSLVLRLRVQPWVKLSDNNDRGTAPSSPALTLRSLDGAQMAKNSNAKWSPEDDRKLLELKGAGKSIPMIAAALRRSASSIMSRLGILKKRSVNSRQPERELARPPCP